LLLKPPKRTLQSRGYFHILENSGENIRGGFEPSLTPKGSTSSLGWRTAEYQIRSAIQCSSNFQPFSTSYFNQKKGKQNENTHPDCGNRAFNGGSRVHPGTKSKRGHQSGLQRCMRIGTEPSETGKRLQGGVRGGERMLEKQVLQNQGLHARMHAMKKPGRNPAFSFPSAHLPFVYPRLFGLHVVHLHRERRGFRHPEPEFLINGHAPVIAAWISMAGQIFLSISRNIKYNTLATGDSRREAHYLYGCPSGRKPSNLGLECWGIYRIPGAIRDSNELQPAIRHSKLNKEEK
jgi:hypothetical protein